ncbi:hypothetical protein D3C83_214080 [compost metagenome]
METRLPPDAALTPVIVSVSPSESVSLPSNWARVIETGVSSVAATLSLPAVGARLVFVTVIVTVAVAVPPLPSLIV